MIGGNKLCRENHAMPPRLLAASAAGIVFTTIAARAEPLAVRPGLWEMTATIQMDQITLPPALLAQMPPETQARMKAAMANLSKPRTLQKCLTPESLARAMEFRSRGIQDCTRDPLQSSAHAFSLHAVCTFNGRGGGGKADLQIHVVADSAEHMHGTVVMNRALNPGDPGPAHANTTIDAVFKSPDCGTVKPDQDTK
jgi:hypothetical protein